MTPTPWTDGRRLVPRWRSLAATLASLELAQPHKKSASTLAAPTDADYLARLERWQLHPSLVTAAELLEASIVAGREKDAVNAARRLIQIDKSATPLIHAQAAAVLSRQGHADEVPSVDQQRLTAQSPRQFTHLYPRDPMAWVELALHQVSANHIEAAQRSMRRAIALSPGNRHVLRSAARLYLHAGEPDRAHDILVRNPATKEDPWLIAAEIALAEVAERDPRFVKLGSRMLEDRAVAPRQLTELAGSIATEDYLNGNRRKARRNFEISMRDPTGSALAQGEWATIQTGSELVSAARLCTTLEAAEATAFHLHRVADFTRIPATCWEWAASDTFSIRPFEFGASTAGLLDEHETAMKLAAAGLKIRPAASSLLNAMAFSLASTGRVSEAADHLMRIRLHERDTSRYVTAANWGLVAFRAGDVPTGREMYRVAVEGFGKLNRADLSARAQIYLAREAILAKLGDAEALLNAAKKAAKAVTDAENDHILRTIEGIQHPAAALTPRRQAQTVIATFPNGERKTFVIPAK